MSSYFMAEVIEQARALKPASLSFDTGLKTVQVLVPEFTYEYKKYTNNAGRKGVGPDILSMPPQHAKTAYFEHQIQIIKNGASDNFKIHGAIGYKPWRAPTEESAAPQSRDENLWIRCRLTKMISFIPGLDVHELIGLVAGSDPPRHEFCDFYAPLWLVRQVNHSIEDEDPSYRAALEIRFPQAPAEVPAKT